MFPRECAHVARWLTVALFSTLSACQDERSEPLVQAPPDAASDATVASGAASGACTGELPVMRARDPATNVELDPDWSCYASAPPEVDQGVTRTVSFGFLRPNANTPAPLASLVTGLTVDFFFGPSTLGEPAITCVFDGQAPVVSLEVPFGIEFVAARLRAIENAQAALSLVEVNEYGLVVSPEEAAIEGYFLIRDSRKLAISLALAGGQEDPTKALIVSAVRDCQGRAVRGAQIELIDGETNVPVATGTAVGLPRSSYAHLALPNPDCTHTSNEQQESSWMLVNAPTNVTDGAKTRAYRLRLKGRMRASDAQPVVLGEREVELFRGGTTYVRLYR